MEQNEIVYIYIYFFFFLGGGGETQNETFHGVKGRNKRPLNLHRN